MNKKRNVVMLICLILFLFCAVMLSACKKEETKYNVSFIVNGEDYKTISINGNEIISLPEDPTVVGYVFNGWFLDKDVWSKPFDKNSLITQPIVADTLVYAKFTAVEYSITYYDEGGSHDNPLNFTINDSVTLLGVEKQGYNFIGWYLDSEFCTKIEAVPVGTTENLTLYAKLELVNYNISYQNIEGAENLNPTSYSLSTLPIQLTNPVKEGYEFIGWFYNDELVTEITSGSTKDINLTASWQFVGYKIFYHNLKNAVNENPEMYDTREQAIVLSGLEKLGYNFLGWYLEEDFKTKVTEIAISSTGVINLYAKWETIEYTATFKNGETFTYEVKFTVETESIVEPALPNVLGYNGAWESYTLGALDITINSVYRIIEYDISYVDDKLAENNNPTKYTIESQTITLTDLTKEGYIFKGWFNGEEKVSEIPKGSTGNITLTAKWNIATYLVTFKEEGFPDIVKRVDDGNDLPLEEIPLIQGSKIGYDVAWEDVDLKNITNNIVVNAVYTPKSYTITIDNNQGVGATTINVTFDSLYELIAPTREDYVFAGWKQNGQDFSEKGVWNIPSDITVVAQWMEKPNEVIFKGVTKEDFVESWVHYQAIKEVEGGVKLEIQAEMEFVAPTDFKKNPQKTFICFVNDNGQIVKIGTETGTGTYILENQTVIVRFAENQEGKQVVAFLEDGYEPIIKYVDNGGTLTDIPTPREEVGANFEKVWVVTDFTNVNENIRTKCYIREKTYRIYYDLENGKVSMTKAIELKIKYDENKQMYYQEVKYQEAYVLLDSIKDPSKKLVGWKVAYTLIDFTSGNSYPLREDVTLTAILENKTVQDKEQDDLWSPNQ